MIFVIKNLEKLYHKKQFTKNSLFLYEKTLLRRDSVSYNQTNIGGLRLYFGNQKSQKAGKGRKAVPGKARKQAEYQKNNDMKNCEGKPTR